MHIDVTRLTAGPRHHFFGYIGHCRTIAFDGTDRYVLALETEFQDHMPNPDDAAGVMLIDTQDNNRLIRLDETRAWNPQQGTMFYWDPLAPDARFFFNDRDRATGRVFTVLYDIKKRERIKEYRFDGTSAANGGVAQHGGRFMAINYGRIARLREVTGYPGAADPTEGADAPEDDGVFLVDAATGERTLVCSFARMREELVKAKVIGADDPLDLFINHTLWNREDDLVMFFARSGPFWGAPRGVDVNSPFVMRPDGSELRLPAMMGGHPEWAPGSRMMAVRDKEVWLYDVNREVYETQVGNAELFHDPGGDKALSPDAAWLVHGNRIKEGGTQHLHRYVFYRMDDGAHAVSSTFERGEYLDGSLRLDAAPCWDRSGTRAVVPALADDGTRQMFLLRLVM